MAVSRKVTAGSGRHTPDPVADLADDGLDGQFGVAASHRVDRAVHAAVAEEVEHRPGHRRPGRVLQRQVRRHLPDRPAVAQRRLAPLLLGQVFEQVHQGAPLIVDRGPHIAVFHRFLRSGPQPVPFLTLFTRYCSAPAQPRRGARSSVRVYRRAGPGTRAGR